MRVGALARVARAWCARARAHARPRTRPPPSIPHQCRGRLYNDESRWYGTPTIAWYQGAVLKGEGVLGYGVHELAEKITQTNDDDTFAEWRGDKACNDMSALTWTKSRGENKLCIPILEGGMSRALRLDVPAPANAKPGAKTTAETRKVEAAALQIHIARSIVNFYKTCSAAVVLENARQTLLGKLEVLKRDEEDLDQSILQLEAESKKLGIKTEEKSKQHTQLQENINQREQKNSDQCKLTEAIAAALRVRTELFNTELTQASTLLSGLAVRARAGGCGARPAAKDLGATNALLPLRACLSLA